MHMRSRLSRLERHKRKQSNRQAFLYLFLSGLFIFGLIKWGLPGLIEIASWSNSREEVDKKDGNQLRLQKPVLAPLPEATFSAKIRVTGAALANEKIKLRLNGLDNAETRSDGLGEFVFSQVELVSGDNEIGVLMIDGDQKSEIDSAMVRFDNDPPSLMIASPDEEHKFYGFDQQKIEIVGEAGEDVNITVNGNYVRVDNKGRFSYQTLMSEGENQYVIRVVDKAGNVTEKLFRVFYTP